MDNRPSKEAPIVSVVIPLYGSRKHFTTLLHLLQQLFPLLGQGSELILVNDGDNDLFHVSAYKKFQIIDARLNILQLKKNCGQMTATLCGMSVAKCPVVLTMDADTCCDAHLLANLAVKAQPSGNLAYLDVLPAILKQPMLRRVLSWINKVVFRILVKRKDLHRSGSSVRAVELSLVKELVQEESCAELIDVRFLNSASKVSFIPYSKPVNYSTSYSFLSFLRFIFRFAKGLFKKKARFQAARYIYEIQNLTS
ncbi:glycosyltransferase [Flavobacteriales bacterium]|nr:glycosyltransferase [Flavobacteriales bacterium]